jgi:hypothetical protein
MGNEVGRQPVELRLKAKPDFALLDRSHPLDQRSKSRVDSFGEVNQWLNTKPLSDGVQ